MKNSDILKVKKLLSNLYNVFSKKKYNNILKYMYIVIIRVSLTKTKNMLFFFS